MTPRQMAEKYASLRYYKNYVDSKPWLEAKECYLAGYRAGLERAAEIIKERFDDFAICDQAQDSILDELKGLEK